jgi:pimeloyl-ACP methyl ester carboxylesterase
MTDTMLAGPAGQLRAAVTGAGARTPVVFAHSFAGSSAQWGPQLDHTSLTRRAVALDFHGHGRSDARPSARFDIPSFAADIAAVADELDLAPFVLVGHSLGGAAAIAYAADHPNRVAGLVLVATPGRLPDEQVQGIAQALDKDYEGTMASIWKRLLTNATPATRRTVEGESDRIPEKVARQIIKATFEFDPVPALGAYDGPRLTVSTPQEGPATELHDLVSGVEHVTVEGTSHWIQLDAPDRFDKILDAFLARVDALDRRPAPVRTPVGAARF